MKKNIATGIAGLLIAGTVLAQDTPIQIVRPSSGNIKDIQIRGRVQAQFGYVKAENDDIDETWNTLELRRVRLGMRGTLFQNFRAQIEANMVPGEDLSMRSAFIEWREHKPAYIKLGYDKPVFGFEENTSSADILTVERTLINNTLVSGPLNGLSMSGKASILNYAAGIYTDSNNRNKDGKDPEYLYNASVGVKLDEIIGQKLRFRGDYISSDDEEGEFGENFKNAIAASMHFAIKGFDLRAEFMQGEDRDDNKTRGGYVMPSMYVTDKLQGVLRAEIMESDSPDGVRAPSRYMRRVQNLESDKGDKYIAGYVGMNYYISSHHKLMLGLEMAELKNTEQGTLEATTLLGGWRMLF